MHSPLAIQQPASEEARGRDLVDAYRGLVLTVSAMRIGLIELLLDKHRVQDISARLDVEQGAAEALLTALQAYGLVEATGEYWSLSHLLREDGRVARWCQLLVDIDVKASTAIIQQRALVELGTVESDIIARAVRAEDIVSRQELARELDAVPYLGQRLRSARRFLEVGCGRGTLLCSLLEHFSEISATAIDSSAIALDSMMELANEAGVAHRILKVAAHVPEEFPIGHWDVAYWSQAFFARSDRRGTLERLFSSLFPDGTLFLFPRAEIVERLDAVTRREYFFERAIFSWWKNPLRSEPELTAEAIEAGFCLKERASMLGTEAVLVFGCR